MSLEAGQVEAVWISLRFTDRLAPEDLSADSVDLSLPLLDGSVPLPPGVLPGHVWGSRHLLFSLVFRDLSDIGLVVLSPLAVGQLFPPPVENAGVSLNLRLLRLRPGSSHAPDLGRSWPRYGGSRLGLLLASRHTC